MKRLFSKRNSLLLISVFLFAAAGAGIYSYIFSPDLTKQSSELAVSSASAATQTPLPFNIPATATLRATSKKVFAHYFTPQPTMINNKPTADDYYTLQYMTPTGESGKHAAYGGFLRDRPMPRAVQTRSDWQVANMEEEVRQAIGAGIDGFFIDVLQMAGDADVQVWNNANYMMDASNKVDPGFKNIVLLDLASSTMAAKTPDVLAAGTKTLVSKPSAYKLSDGRTVVGALFANKHDVAWWTDYLNIMKTTHGVNVAFVPIFLDEQPYRASFAPISYAISNWGNDNPAWNSLTDVYATSPRGRAQAVHNIPMKWMQPVRIQDVRPNGKKFGEAQNSQNLRNTWQNARTENAEMVQLVTWNDYSEGASTAPSLNNGFAWLDVNAYYSAWYKTGTAPAIARDAVYLSHRKHFAAQAPTYVYPDKMLPHGGSSSPTRDTIEALTFLTAPGTVTITSGSTSVSCNAPAGVSTCVVPLALGTPAAKVTRNSAVVTNVTSKWAVTATPYVQDMAYVMASSGRTGNDLVGSLPPPPPPAGDTTKPVTSISSPSANSTAKDTITVTGSATDNVGITKVELLVDGNLKTTDGAAPFASFSFDTKTVADGAHSLTLKAYDAAGNNATSAGVAITISNTTPPPAPIITSFTANPSTITAGSQSTLSWVTQNVSSCNVNTNTGATQDTTASSYTTSILTTTGTKTYTLVCYNPAVVSTSKSVIITVNAAPTPPSKPTFTADKTTIQTGGTVNFNWGSAGATSCVFNPGNVGGAAGINGKPVINITATTTYTLSCSNAVGTTQADPITITVSAAPVVAANPVIASFKATPNSIGYGETSTLTWATTGVISGGCNLNPGTSQGPNGSLIFASMIASASYTLTCKNPDGKTTSASTSITVAGKPAPVAPPPKSSTVKNEDATKAAVTNAKTQQPVANVSVDDSVQGLASLDISNIVDTEKEQSITYVEYYDGETLVQKVTKAPFALNTKLLKNGSYSITERTYYLDGSKSEVTKVLGVENAAAEVQGAEAGTPIQKSPILYALLTLTVVLAVVAFATRRRWLPIAILLTDNARELLNSHQKHDTTNTQQTPENDIDNPTVIRPDKKE